MQLTAFSYGNLPTTVGRADTLDTYPTTESWQEQEQQQRKALNFLCTIEREYFIPSGSWSLAYSPPAEASQVFLAAVSSLRNFFFQSPDADQQSPKESRELVIF